MIDISACNRNADRIDEVIINIKTIINNYEEAIYYIKKNDSVDARLAAKNIENQIHILENEKTKLAKISETIRTKAKEIYTKELEEQEARRRAEENNTINYTSSSYSSN